MRAWATIIALVGLTAPASADVVVHRSTAIQSAELSCIGESKRGVDLNLTLRFDNLRSVRSVSGGTEFFTISYDVAIGGASEVDLPNRLTAYSTAGSPPDRFPFQQKLTTKGWSGQLSFARDDISPPTHTGNKTGHAKGALLIWPTGDDDGFVGRCEGIISLDKLELEE